MNINRVNEIIADYMGDHYVFEDGRVIRYIGSGMATDWTFSESLDALVPVWEQLMVCDSNYFWTTEKVCNYIINTLAGGCNIKTVGMSTVIQEAAAIATAKAIHGLENEKQ